MIFSGHSITVHTKYNLNNRHVPMTPAFWHSKCPKLSSTMVQASTLGRNQMAEKIENHKAEFLTIRQNHKANLPNNLVKIGLTDIKFPQ